MARGLSAQNRILGILSIFLLCAVLIVALATRSQDAKEGTPGATATPDPMTSQEATPSITPTADQELFLRASKRLHEQAAVDADLLKELDSGAYTFDAPLVVVDPYDRSPLTALLVFQSAVPLNLSIHVEGTNAASAVDFTFEGFATRHIVPVYGLFAGRSNMVELTSRAEDGTLATKTLSIATEPLPQPLQDIVILTELRFPELYQPGLNFTYGLGGIKLAFDIHGDYRWFLKDSYRLPTLYGFNGRTLIADGSEFEGDVLFYEINPLGRIYRILYSPYGIHHDMVVFQHRTLLMTGSHGETIEDFVYGLDSETGSIRSTLDLKTVLQRTRAGLDPAETLDWLHMNAIIPVAGGDDILVSGRNQSVIARLSWPEGRIRWLFSSPKNWSTLFYRYLLTPVGADFEWSYNQHAPKILPDQDGNPDTLDILVFDNGNQRFLDDPDLQHRIQNHEIVAPELYSRLVQYRIDEKKSTVQQIWQYGKEQGALLYSMGRGNVQQLPNGNVFGLFLPNTGNMNYPCAIEVSKVSGLVWQAMATTKVGSGSLNEYRMERMTIYGPEANDLQIGTPAVDLIPQEVLTIHGLE
jgi:arylsulfate sulfotransferase